MVILRKLIEKVLERFNMSKTKAFCSPLTCYFKLGSKQCPISENDMKEMRKVPYAFVVGSMMYTMVCARSDIAHTVGVVSQFLSNTDVEFRVSRVADMELKLSKSVMIDLVFYSFCYDIVFNYFLGDLC